MSRYNYNNGTYYDPVGSQQNQPTGYTYGGGTSTTAAPNYPSSATASYQNAPGTSAYQGYGSSYTSQQQAQQYGGTVGQTAGSSTNRASAPLSGLGGQEYNQQQAASNTASSNTHDGSNWGTAGYGGYNGGLQQPNRSQSNNSPSYATQAATSNSNTTFGRLSVPDQNNQQSAPSYPAGYQGSHQATTTPSNPSRPTGYTQQQAQAQTQPQQQQTQRYSSPLHAVQSQQSHSKQASRGSNQHQPSPHMASAVHSSVQQAGQQSASVEPSPTTMTVNPSQVYDDSAERRRKAQIEAEKRRKREEEQAARKAEEDRVAAELTAEEDKQKAEKEAAVKKAEYERKADARKKAREEKRQSKSAATTLQRMASGSAGSSGLNAVLNDEQGPPLNEEEAEMRAMFQKMREFNSKNPAMLAKLWEEERKTHSSGSPNQPARAAPTAASASRPKQAPKPSPSGSNSQMRPFAKPPQPKAPAQKPVQKPATPIHAQASTSLWPPQKKGSLAEAAAKWLANLPENEGKKIARDDVLRILEANPSYVQLCEALEGLGMRFERSSLARELLKAVPDGMKAQVHQNPLPDAPTPPSATNGTGVKPNGASDTPKKRGRPPKNKEPATVEYEAPRFTSLSDAAREVNAMGQPTVPMGGPVQSPYAPQQPSALTPQISMLPPNSGLRAPSALQTPEIKPEIKPEEPPRPPADKEEAARKRTFGDLVDLTAQDSDDDEGPPKKMMFPMPVQANQPNGASAPSHQPSPAAPPPNFGLLKPMNAQDLYRNNVKPGQATPWNAFNPPPIAPASGQPHAAPPPKPNGPTSDRRLDRQQQERIRGRMLVEPIMRDRVARKSKYDSRTIARDVLLATGRHPDMRPLNSHLNIMARLLGDHGGPFEDDSGRGNRSDLSTVRWDIIDPGEPAKVETKAKPAVLADETADADDEDDELADVPAAAAPRMVQQTVDNGDGTVSYVSVHEQITGKPKKRRRRRVVHPEDDSVTLTNGQGVRQTVVLGAGRDGTPVPAAAATAGAVGYSAFRQLDGDGNVIKKKGRPVGWRKNLHSREAQGLTPPKPSGPRGPRKSGAEKELVEPRYQVWKCKWKGCPAELHNLDTLKKHVVKVHGKPNGDREFECLWEGCQFPLHSSSSGKGKAKAADVDDRDVVATFPDLAKWLEHVDQQHLQPVAWKLGDGPRGGTSDFNATDSEAYLSDAQGRSVTPVIRPFELDTTNNNMTGTAEASSRVLPAPLRKLGGAQQQQHMTKDERKAAAELEELERHKGVVGVTMEKGGATWANKKRRGGFLDDEEFEDEVETEGEHAEGEGDEWVRG